MPFGEPSTPSFRDCVSNRSTRPKQANVDAGAKLDKQRVLKGDSKAPPFSPRTPLRSECFSGAAPRGAQSSLRCPQSRVMQEAPELRQPREVAHIQAFVRASRKRRMTGFESDRSAEKSKPNRRRLRARIGL